jgi:hypothetical protein
VSGAGLDAALSTGDLDELLRWVDRLCDAQDWDGLVRLRQRCRSAFEASGRQLWPIVSQVEYRLALEAPALWAAAVLVEGAGRFAFGPLAEVAASTHTWAELAPHVVPGPVAGLAAHERVVRGERVDPAPAAGPFGMEVLELPGELPSWEPAYALACYRRDEVELPAPPPPVLAPLPVSGANRVGPVVVDDVEVCGALRALVERWVVESNGVVVTMAVQGSAEAAIAAVAGRSPAGWGQVGGGKEARSDEIRGAEVTLDVALAAMAWAGASGGAHGRRRGAAAGRFGAWWALAAVAGLLDDWPLPPQHLGDAAAELRWLLWEPARPKGGWSLHLAVEDPVDQLAWAIAATDQS